MIPPQAKLPSQPPPPPTSSKIPSPPPPPKSTISKPSQALIIGRTLLKYRKTVLFGLGLTYFGVNGINLRAKQRKRDFIENGTYLYWRVYPGSIVEVESKTSTLTSLLAQKDAGPEIAQVMSLPDVLLSLKRIEKDDRIRGMIADFSSNAPSAASYTLGLAQIEEIQSSLKRVQETKRQKFGDQWKSVAFTDSFADQASYLFATQFEKVYTQISGSVPLVGLSTTVPFFGRLLEWLGVEVLAEARTEWKSFVQPYISDQLTIAQKQNQIELISDLNDNFLTYIARNRFPSKSGQEGLDHVKKLSQIGPYSATQAIAAGLLDGTTYRSDILDGIKPENLKGFVQYAKITEKEEKRQKRRAPEPTSVGVIYLIGTIGGGGGEFSASSVIRGLKEAAKDEKVQSVVLRIDSGGGGVIESDSIWAAVRDFKKTGKTIISSFANASASGGYLVSTHMDSIICSPSTITGSIGVAALRPTLTQRLLDRVKLTTDSYFTGSKFLSPIHSLTPEERARYAGQVDELYDDFKSRVSDGRGMTMDQVEALAGGRVYSGLRAFGLSAPAPLISAIKGLDHKATPTPVIPPVSVDASVIPAAVEGSESEIINLEEKSIILDAATPEIPSSIPSTPVVISIPSAVLQDPNSVGRSRKGGKPGIIDGIGGLMDSISYAHAIQVAKAQRKLDEERKSDTSSETYPLPVAIIETEPDLILKRFPVSKTFLERIKEASAGEDITPIESAQLFASEALIAFTSSIMRAAVARELKAINSSVAETGVRVELPDIQLR